MNVESRGYLVFFKYIIKVFKNVGCKYMSGMSVIFLGDNVKVGHIKILYNQSSGCSYGSYLHDNPIVNS